MKNEKQKWDEKLICFTKMSLFIFKQLKIMLSHGFHVSDGSHSSHGSQRSHGSNRLHGDVFERLCVKLWNPANIITRFRPFVRYVSFARFMRPALYEVRCSVDNVSAFNKISLFL